MTTLSLHTLNTSTGSPAEGIRFALQELTEGSELETGATDGQGRYSFSSNLAAGTYRIRFDTDRYFDKTPHLYPFVDIAFSLDGSGGDHLHIPLLISPFGYTTYRGS